MNALNPLRSLERFARPPRATARGGRTTCEICAAPAGEPHRHVLDLQRRALACACGACATLFVDAGAGGGRFRTVPDRVRYDPAFAPTAEEWAALGVPVRLAFLVREGVSRRWTAFLPGAAGAVEAELSPAAAEALVARTPLAPAAEPDVEALLVHGGRGAARLECLLVPVSACYELAGHIRRSWQGFDGGDAVRREIDATFQALRGRARPLAGRRGRSP